MKLKPDFFDGTNLQDIDKKVKNKKDTNNLYSLIIPTKHSTFPVVYNFFLKAKVLNKSAYMLRQQTYYNNVFGTRIIHSL